jgi:hypothetical protein
MDGEIELFKDPGTHLSSPTVMHHEVIPDQALMQAGYCVIHIVKLDPTSG